MASFNYKILRAKRRELALTQEKLAESSGLSDRHIRSMERGSVDNPSAASLYRISKALDITMDELMRESDGKSFSEEIGGR